MLKLNKHIFFVIIFFLIDYSVSAQEQEEYLFPIHPGQRNYLAGTMGELRGSHFHGGIDIKTGGRVGLDVYATADGYVSRIKVSPYGYGNALYIYHPKDGTTSVYGHLNAYEGRIADYVLKEQYKRKSFSIDISVSKDLFPVNKGDLVAYSGNTGGSSGPHLHFEIRDHAQRPLNPLHYGFDEIIDNIPPVVQLMAFRSLDTESRVADQYQTEQYALYRRGSDYYISQKVEAWGEIGAMVMGYDLLDGVPNRNGIPKLTMKLDGELISSIHVNKVPFSENRNILIYRDYELKNNENKSFQKLYKENGCHLDIYETLTQEGRLCIFDTLEHKLEIELEDAYGNSSTIHATIVGKKPEKKVSLSSRDFKPFKQKIEGNTLFFMGKKEENNGLLSEVYANRMKYEIVPSYYVNDYAVYHWDLRKGLPDSINVCHEFIYPNFDVMVPPKTEFSFFNNHMDVFFGKRTLFDTLYLNVDYADEWDDEKEFFIVGEDNVPLRSYMTVRFKPQKEYKNKDKVRAYYTTNLRNFYYEGGKWVGDKFELNTRTLGTYSLLADTIPPTLTVYQLSRNKIQCRISDNLSGIDDYDVYVNGEWVLMHYDYKTQLITSEKLDKSKPFSGEVVISIVDNSGNEKKYESKIY